MFAINPKKFYTGFGIDERKIENFVKWCFKQVLAVSYAYRDENTLILSDEENEKIIEDYIVSFIYNTLAENDIITEYYPRISFSFFWRMRKDFADGFEIEIDKNKMQVFGLNKITKERLENVVKNCFLERKYSYSLTEPCFYIIRKSYEIKGRAENFLLGLKGDLYYVRRNYNEKLVICDEGRIVKVYEIYERKI